MYSGVSFRAGSLPYVLCHYGAEIFVFTFHTVYMVQLEEQKFILCWFICYYFQFILILPECSTMHYFSKHNQWTVMVRKL